ncbi:MAG: nucleoside deaminase [Ruminococcaceae bacterium]|jgi:tRNA(adenine34) deaminase|nr:nucleoside deaminase [Oscillospiraceae bacterium]
MRLALNQARAAARMDEVPVGAVVVHQGQVIGRGHNRRETRQDVTLHAEMVAIRQACHHLGSWRLDQCDLYVTLEPCVMCAGAIVQSRIRTLVYGSRDPKAGACGSVVNVPDLPLHHVVQVESGVLSEESSALLKQFFQKRRRLDKQAGTRSSRHQQAVQQAGSTEAEKKPDPFAD